MKFSCFYLEIEVGFGFFFLSFSSGSSGQELTLSVFCKTGNGGPSTSMKSGVMCFCTVEEPLVPHCSVDVATHLLAMGGLQ